jgi:hypothetical protein
MAPRASSGPLDGAPELFGRKASLPDDAFYVHVPDFSAMAIHRDHAPNPAAHGYPLFMGRTGHRLLFETEGLKNTPHRLARQRAERHGWGLGRSGDERQGFLKQSCGGCVQLHTATDIGVPEPEVQRGLPGYEIANMLSVRRKCVAQVSHRHMVELLARLPIGVTTRVKVKVEADREPSSILVPFREAPEYELFDVQANLLIPGVHPLYPSP